MSCIQTVEIYQPRAPFPIYGLEVCPILPTDKWAESTETAVRKVMFDGTKIIWYPNGNVQMYLTNGMIKVWYRRPSMQEAVHAKPPGRKFFQFNRDGSMISFMAGAPFYWSAPMDADAVMGPFESSYHHPTDGWIFDGDEHSCDSCHSR
jgi:hypothetical protein